MAVVLLAAFLIIACLLALRFEKQLTAVLPLATCILILILYVLAFFRRLSWIDYFSTAIVVGAVLRVLFLSGEKKRRKSCLHSCGSCSLRRLRLLPWCC